MQSRFPQSLTPTAARSYPPPVDPILRPILEPLVAALAPRSIWLFGSRAEQRARPESDWDILVVMPNGTPPEDLDPIGVWKRFGQGPVPVDLVPCTQAEFDEERFEPDSLPAAAWRRGRCLYERPA